MISESIIGAAIEVHKFLGSGLLEAVYEICLIEEMEQRRLKVQQQVRLPLYYKGQPTKKVFTIDLLVENDIVNLFVNQPVSKHCANPSASSVYSVSSVHKFIYEK